MLVLCRHQPTVAGVIPLLLIPLLLIPLLLPLPLLPTGSLKLPYLLSIEDRLHWLTDTRTYGQIFFPFLHESAPFKIEYVRVRTFLRYTRDIDPRARTYDARGLAIKNKSRSLVFLPFKRVVRSLLLDDRSNIASLLSSASGKRNGGWRIRREPANACRVWVSSARASYKTLREENGRRGGRREEELDLETVRGGVRETRVDWS